MTELHNPNRVEYLDHIKKQKDSGLSIKKYCDENGLIEHKFNYYRSYKLKADKPKASVNSFAKVSIKDPQNKQPINKTGKKTNIDPVWLANFVKALVD